MSAPSPAAPAPATAPAATTPVVTLAELYRQVWRHAAGSRLALVVVMAMLAASQLLKLAMPWMAAQAIDAIQTGRPGSMAEAGRWIAGIVGLTVGVWLLHGPARVVERNIGLKVRRSLTDALYAKLAKAPLAWHERHHSGELQHRVKQASGALYDFTQNQFIYLQNAVNLIGPLVALALLSPLTGGVAAAGYLLIGLTIVAFDGALMRLADRENQAERRYAARLLDFVSNVSSLMSLRLQPSARKLLDRRMDDVAAPLKRSIVLNEWKWCAVDFFAVGLCWGLVAAYAWQAHASAGTVAGVALGGLFMVYQYARQAAGVIGAMASHYQAFARTKTDFASSAAIWQAPVRPADVSAPSHWQHIELHGLEFRHAGHGDDSEAASRGGVRGVALRLRRGERIALVGPSGAGKSTLLRLLAGLYEPNTVRVAIDGRAADMRQLAACATLIPQETEIFESSVRENLDFGTVVDEATLQTAVRVSAFDTVLAGLPEGLETAIGERGTNLSGGQRQRLALARGVLAARASSVLLLDEPTSALDPLTERQVHQRLREAFPEACVIASVHRMGLLEHFDRVALMVDGRLVDIGPLDALRKRQPVFAQMLQGAAEEATAVPREAAATV